MDNNVGMAQRYEHEIPDGYEARIEGSKVIIELKVSEDEKIRKAIGDAICGTTAETVLEANGVKLVDALAYLERQKEHQNNSYTPNKSFWKDTNSSSDNERNLDELAREYIDGVKRYHTTPNWDLMQTAVCYGYHLREEVGSECVESVKPAEWSDEDERMLSNCVSALKEGANGHAIVIDYGEHEKWLNSLPERFNLQSKQEWSEEDEAMYELFFFVIELIGNCPDKEKVKNWIKEIKGRFINSDYRSVGLHFFSKK